jgi:hypothetical protein
LITIYAAKELPPGQFGAFGLAFVTYAFLLNASRGLSTEPLLVRHSGEESSSWRTAVAQMSGLALVVGTIFGIAAATIGVAIGGRTGWVWLALAIGLPGLMLQDSWRYAFFSVGRGARAFLNDLVWALVLLLAVIVMHTEGRNSGGDFMLVWGLSATAAAAIGGIQAALWPHVRGAWTWLVANWDLCPRYMAENLSVAGARQLRFTALAVFSTLSVVGDVRAAEVLRGPFLVIVMGLGLVAVPEAVTVMRRSPERLRTFCLLLGSAEALAAALWGAIILIWLPHGLGQLLLGHIWKATSPLVLPTMISGAISCFAVGGSVGLHALGLARRSLRAQLVWAGAYLIGGVGGAIIGGGQGTSWGVVGATLVGAVYFQFEFDRGLAEHPLTRPTADDTVDLTDPVKQPTRSGRPAEATS